MTYLQENEENFVKFLMKEYGIKVSNKLRRVKYHTKSRRTEVKNRIYDIKIPMELVKKDEELEKLVEELREEKKYKNGSKI